MAKGVPSLNDRATVVGKEMVARAAELGVAATQVAGVTVIDSGVKAVGGIEAGLLLTRMCLADLGTAKVVPGHVGNVPLPSIAVNVTHPVPACMASQYAGWQISEGDFFAMGSGPFRAVYGKEELFNDIGFREQSKTAVGVLETSALPGPEVVGYLAGKLQVAPERMMLACARTASLAGSVQVVARSVETALHKLHEINYDITQVVAGFGNAPLAPVAKNDVAAIGRTNDAVLYGGEVTLMVTGDDDAIRAAGTKLPSNTSSDYGRPFAEVFASYDHDFYKIDPMLFSPAVVSVQNIDTGNVFTFGQLNHAVLAESFFGG